MTAEQFRDACIAAQAAFDSGAIDEAIRMFDRAERAARAAGVQDRGRIAALPARGLCRYIVREWQAGRSDAIRALLGKPPLSGKK